MSKISKVKRCYHCGAILQEDNPNEPGYISPDIINKYPDGLLVCNECFESEKEGIEQENMIDEDYFTILEQIKEKKALVVYVVDLFSFEGSFIDSVNERLKSCDVLAVGNKRDLFPDSIDDNELLEYVFHRLRVSKLDVKDVVLTSTTNGHNIDLLIKKIIELGKNKDVYFVGVSTSGKSALIEEILKKYENKTNEYIVTHTFSGTYLRGFRIPLGNKHYIFEMPGLPIKNSMISKVDLNVLKKIVPNKTLSPRKYRLSKKGALMFGGLAFVQFMDGPTTTINVFCSKSIELKTTNFGQEKFSSVLIKHNLKPCYEKFRSLADFDVYDLKIVEQGSRDVGILGLGWFSFIGNNQTIRVYVPNGVYVYSTRSKIK